MKKLPSPAMLARGLTILILLIFFLSAGSIFLPLCRKDQQNMCAEIYQNGVLIQTIDLSAVKEPYSFIITGENGAANEIQVNPGSIGILSATCPDKICVHQGFLTNDLLPITCLPNHLVIRLVPAKDAPSSLDAVTY